MPRVQQQCSSPPSVLAKAEDRDAPGSEVAKSVEESECETTRCVYRRERALLTAVGTCKEGPQRLP